MTRYVYYAVVVSNDKEGEQMKSKFLFYLVMMLFPAVLMAETCIDPRDTYSEYDQFKQLKKFDGEVEWYAMSYSWSPSYCAKLKEEDKKPGKADFLQCGSDRAFKYVLHGFWPQGELAKGSKYPENCEGDYDKIPRSTLEPYFCMTPSAKLLQHEFEKHGLCMHDKSLRNPESYFSIAKQLFDEITMPYFKLPGEYHSVAQSKETIVELNDGKLTVDNFYYNPKYKEWLFCYDTDFELMSCPDHKFYKGEDGQVADANCKVKGNISSKGKKLYFLPGDNNYTGVKIEPSKGEKCFDTAEEAEAAGWQRAS